MKKISKIAKVLDSILDVVFKLWLIGIIFNAIFIVLGLCLLFFDITLLDFNHIGELMLRTLNFGDVTVELKEGYVIAEGLGSTYFALYTVGGIIKGAIYAVGTYIIRNILKPMIQEEPFRETAVMNLKKAGWIVIIYAVIKEIYDFVQYMFITKNFDLEQLLTSGQTAEVSTNYIFGTDFILFAAVLFLLSHVFKHGQELQRLSDETL